MTDRVRAMLLAWTVLATGGWVVSAFAVDGLVSSPSSRPGLPAVFWLALGIELAAVAGWLGLGVALWWRARRCGGLGAWADLCLRTMSVGSVPLAVAGAATAGMGWSDAEMPGGWAAFLGMHGVALLLSGGVMTAVFVRGGGGSGRRWARCSGCGSGCSRGRSPGWGWCSGSGGGWWGRGRRTRGAVSRAPSEHPGRHAPWRRRWCWRPWDGSTGACC